MSLRIRFLLILAASCLISAILTTALWLPRLLERTFEREDALVIFGLLGFGFVLAALLMTLLLERMVGRRSRQLVLAAEAISRGDYTASLPPPGEDELGRLSAAFAQMREVVAAEQRALVVAREAAESADRAKSNFLAVISHELRTPLNGILGMAQLLTEPMLDAASRQEHAHVIMRSGRTLLDRLNDILEYVRLESGGVQFEQNSFTPAQVIQEALAHCAPAALDKGLKLKGPAFSGLEQSFTGDRLRITHMIGRLLDNAIRVSPSGTIRISIAELERKDEYSVLELTVTDEGPGLAAETLQHLFQPFSQTEAPGMRRGGGTGLGLAIVRAQAEAMQGSAGVDSETGHGARFWFRIRLRHGKAPTPWHDNRASLVLPTLVASSAHARILVVDDNPINCKVVSLLLGRLGYAVDEADDGSRALRHLQTHDWPALILMDCQMPVMDGYETTRHIRAIEAAEGRPRIPIVAFTASSFEDEEKNCLNAGMDDLMVKPVDATKLRTLLQHWLAPHAGAELSSASAAPTRSTAQSRASG